MKERTSGFLALLVCLPLFLLSLSAMGQVVATGLPPFGSFDSDSFATVNLANLNVHIEIPLRSLPGRGFPLKLALGFDTATLGLPGNLYGPGSPIGWPGTGSSGVLGLGGTVEYQRVTTSCSIPGGGTNYGDYSVISNFYYSDAHGTLHYFPSNVQVATYLNDSKTPCPYYNYPSNPQVTAYATDGSPYVLYATNGSGAPAAYVIDESNGVKNESEDANGNQNLFANNTFTDSSGNVAMTLFSGSSSASYTDYYTGPDGQPKTIVISEQPVSTTGVVGCTNVQDPGPSTSNQIAKITLPDNTFYSFTYESVLGRPAVITLPTGGQIKYTYNGPNNGISCVDGGISGFTKQTPDGTWTYARAYDSKTQLWTTTVTDPIGNQTVYTFGNGSGYLILGGHAAQYEIQRVENQLIKGVQVPLRTTVTCYNGNFSSLKSCTTAVFPTAAANGTPQTVSQKDIYTYLPGVSAPSLSEIKYQFANVITEDKEYDFGATFPPGTNFVRDRKITYAAYSVSVRATHLAVV